MPDFSKQDRLLSAREYQPVFDKPDFRVSHPNFLFLCRSNDVENARLGLVIAKKNLRLASQRNRIKRLIRESFRHQKHQLGNLDVIVLARRNLETLDNPEVAKILNKLWRKTQTKASPKAQQSEQSPARAWS
ncbi:ribonuclease P protein component [Sessilibacter sp. MAH2]